MSRILGLIKGKESDERKMLRIIKNGQENRLPGTTDQSFAGLCRVSFKQTYGYQYPGDASALIARLSKI